MKKSAAIFIGKYEKKILIIKRSENEHWMPGKWAFPGGCVEKNESPKNAVSRECLEEVGLIPFNVKLYKIIEKTNITVYVFEGIYISDDVLLDTYESSEYTWVNKYNYQLYDYAPDCKKLLKEIFKY